MGRDGRLEVMAEVWKIGNLLSWGRILKKGSWDKWERWEKNEVPVETRTPEAVTGYIGILVPQVRKLQ